MYSCGSAYLYISISAERKLRMNINDIKMNGIYRFSLGDQNEDVFAYIRKWKNNEIGFSVLDHISEYPDLSDCGIFWVDKYDFALMFERC